MKSKAVQFFELIDIFGLDFKFQTFGKSSYHSLVSVVFSMIVIFLLFFFTVYLGEDFFKQINPRITLSEDHPKNSNRFIKLNPLNFTLAFRFELNGAERREYNYSGVFFPIFTYQKFDKTKQISSTTIPYYKCNNASIVKDPTVIEYFSVNTTASNTNNANSSWNCLDLQNNDVKIGGVFGESDTSYSLVLKIKFCPDGNFRSPLCTTYSKLQDVMYVTGVWFSLLTPYYYFDKQHREHEVEPLRYEYRIQKTLMDLYLFRQDRIYYEEINNNYDKGIILPEETPTKVLTTSKFESYFTTVLKDAWLEYDKDHVYGEDNMWDSVYQLRFYLDNVLINSRFYYMKAQDLAAIIGGLMSILLNAGTVIATIFNKYYQNVALINEYFEISENNYNKFRRVSTFQNNNIEKKITKEDIFMKGVRKRTSERNISSKSSPDDLNRVIEMDFRDINKNTKNEIVIQTENDNGNNGDLNNSDRITTRTKPKSNTFKSKFISNTSKSLKRITKRNNLSNIPGSSGHSHNNQILVNQFEELSLLRNDVKSLQKNLLVIENPRNEKFYDINKLKGELVLTDNSLSKRNKIFNYCKFAWKGSTGEDRVKKIFETYVPDKVDDFELTERAYDFSLGKYIRYNLMNLCCKSKSNDNKIRKLNMYNYASNVVNSFLDITSFIKLQSTVRNLKILTLPGNHLSRMFDMFKKPNLGNKEELINLDMDNVYDNDEEKLKSYAERQVGIMKYFAENFDSLNEVEKLGLAFDLLDPKYKLYIIDAAKELNKGDDMLPKTEFHGDNKSVENFKKESNEKGNNEVNIEEDALDDNSSNNDPSPVQTNNHL